MNRVRLIAIAGLSSRTASPKHLAELVAALALAVLVLLGLSCSPDSPPRKLEPISIGTVRLEPSFLILVAEDQGFFKDNGLDVSIEYYETGLATANAMVHGEGEVDIAGPVTEYVLASKALGRENVEAIASIDRVDYASIVASRDRGIHAVADLRGKRIGVARGTMLEFRLGRFLELNGIQGHDVAVVDTPLAQSAEAIARGDIDAVVAVPPHVEAAEARLGERAVRWAAQGGQLSYQLLLVRAEWAEMHAGTVERFLKAIGQAEEYALRRPNDAKAFLQQELNLTNEDVTRIWSQNAFALSLEQAMIIAMEDEARWMIKNGLVKAEAVPDFVEFTHLDILRKIRPQAVNIIR